MSDLSKIQASDILVEYTLECSQCGKPASANGATNVLEAATDFNDAGWKVIKGEVVCPDCQNEETP